MPLGTHTCTSILNTLGILLRQTLSGSDFITLGRNIMYHSILTNADILV